MRLAKELLPSRRHLETVQRCFERVRGFVGPARPVTSLRLANEDGRIIARGRGFSFEADSGQLLLDFDSLAAAMIAGEIRDAPIGDGRRAAETGAYSDGDEDSPRGMFREIVASGTRDAEVHLRIASFLERAGDWAAALRHLLSGATIEPDNAEVHTRLGMLYRVRGNFDAALKSFIRALECDSDAVEPHRNLAELYEQAGRKREAIRHLSAVHRLTRED
jgi:Flp pilus assembly protein TadD